MPAVWFDKDTAKKARSDIFDAVTKPLMAQHFDNVVNQLMPDLLANYRPHPPDTAPSQPAAGVASPPPLPAAPPAPDVSAPLPPPEVPFPSGAGAGDLTQTIRQSAQKYGIDPDVAMRVAMSEGGVSQGSAPGDSNSSFGPFQLHYGKVASGGNAVAGLGDEFTRQTGLDARDPANAEAAIDFALKNASQSGWGAFHGAARAGVGERDGIIGASPHAAEALPGSASADAKGVGFSPGQAAPGGVSQFDLGLNAEDAYAFCGPAAAIAFANDHGRYPTVDEAKALAQKYGWTPQAGMAGIASEQKMLSDGLGIPTKLEQNVDWSHVASDANGGNPVIISTPGHYFYVSGARDGQDGQEFYVGKSGTALRGGSEWMTADQMQQRMGQVQGALYADNPQTSGQSVASQGDGNPLSAVGDFLGGVKDAAGNALSNAGQNIGQAVGSAVGGAIGGPAGAEVGGRLGGAGGGFAQQQGTSLLTEPLPGTQNLVHTQTKEMQAGAGISPYEAGQQQLNPTEQYVQARGIASGLAGMVNPEDIAGQAAATGALPKAGVAASRFARNESGELNLDALVPPAQAASAAAAAPEAAAAAEAVTAHGLTINLPKYTPPEVRNVIQQAYDAHPEIMDAARRGVVPDDVVQELAAQSGSNVQRITNLWKPGQAKNAETILALRQSLADQSQAVLQAQADLKTNPNSVDARNTLLSAITKHAAVQEVVTGVTAEAGRALRQFRQGVEGEQANLSMVQKMASRWKVTPDELATKLAGADLSDPAQVASVARTLVKHTPSDYLSSLWYFNLLSSPLTHIRNVVSNSITAAVAPLEAIPAATVDVGRSMLTGAPRERFYGEAGARYFGLGAGMREGMTNALQIFSRGFTDAQAAGKLEQTAAASEPFQGWAGKVINAPGRALGAEDAFFRTINQTASLYAQAYRTASQEGLKGAQLAERVSQLRAAPTTEMLTEAEKEGAFRVFQDKGNLAKWASGMPGWMRFFVPFVNTPINIAKYTLQYSPVGLGTIAIDAARGAAGTAGQVEDRVGRAAIGSAIMAGLVMYAKDGNITGAAPDSPSERDAFNRQHPAYSIKMGDQWVSYQAMQPFSSLFAVAASIQQAQDRGLKLEPAAAFTMGAFAVAKSLTDMPWTQGLTNALEAQHDPHKMAGAYTESVARSAVFPTAFWGWVERATDEMLRDPQDWREAMAAQFPPTAGMVAPRQNAFGRDVERPPQQMGLGALNPFSPASVKDDPVEKALADLQVHGYNVEPGFVGDKATVPHIPTQVTLTDPEQRQIQKTSGQLAYGILLPMVTSPGWDKVPPMERARVVNNVMSKTREYARAQLIPQLAPRAITGFKQEMSSGVRKPVPQPAGAP